MSENDEKNSERLTLDLNNSWAHVDPDGKPFIVLSELYDALRAYAERNGEKEIPTAQKFGKRIKQLIPDYESRVSYRTVGGRQVRVLVGYYFNSTRKF